jgi:cyclic pyranopterin phosphate synthase
MVSCLYNQKTIDLIPAMKNNTDEEEIRKRIVEAVQQKPKDGLKSGHDNAVSSMSRIGG